MVQERPLCPECGDPLSITAKTDSETGEIAIDFFCEGPRNDQFRFQILTGLMWGDLEELEAVGKTMRRQMEIKLLRRVAKGK